MCPAGPYRATRIYDRRGTVPLPEEARKLIAQSIAHTAVATGCTIPEGGSEKLTDQIERELEAAGFVVLSRENLDDRIEEGSYEANYEDGQ
jgi:phytoene dehydrogenase-like protein